MKQTSRCCSVHDEFMALYVYVYVSWWCRKAHALRASCRNPHAARPRRASFPFLPYHGLVVQMI